MTNKKWEEYKKEYNKEFGKFPEEGWREYVEGRQELYKEASKRLYKQGKIFSPDIQLHNEAWFILNARKIIKVVLRKNLGIDIPEEAISIISEPNHKITTSNISVNLRAAEKYILKDGVYKTIEMFLSTAKIFIPCEKDEYINGFWNIWWNKRALQYIIGAIIKSGDGAIMLEKIEI